MTVPTLPRPPQSPPPLTHRSMHVGRRGLSRRWNVAEVVSPLRLAYRRA